jgi:predicted phage terminase large subunit-like protein
MIFMPPRHGKSELASRRFPAWFLGRQPNRSIIAASYNSDIASDFGREVRNIVAAPEYRALFDISLRQDSQAANRWHTDQGGMYVAAGVGTAVTGRGAHVFLIDDPFKDREEADSEAHREKVKRWYTSTAYTRLENDLVDDAGELSEDEALWAEVYAQVKRGDAAPFEGAIVVIQTRWHEQDLSGWLLDEMDAGADRWEKLELPAIDDDGRALWPSKYPLERLEAIKRVIGERDWSALYQQRPSPDEGTYFKRAWFEDHYYEDEPTPRFAKDKPLRIYGASDYAVTEDGGDYTVHIVIGLDEDDDIYVLDLWREQTESDQWAEAFCTLIKKWKPLTWAEASDQIRKAIGPFLTKLMIERKAYCHRDQLSEAGRDKATKARSFQARAAMGKVRLPAKAPWTPTILNELLSCWSGRNDDIADALGLIGRMLDQMVGAASNKGTKKTVDRWDRAFSRQEREIGSNNWKAT